MHNKLSIRNSAAVFVGVMVLLFNTPVMGDPGGPAVADPAYIKTPAAETSSQSETLEVNESQTEFRQQSGKKWRRTVKVDDDGVECPGAEYSTIQAAVDSGARSIFVCQGTYQENVIIGPDANTKIRGCDPGLTVVTGADGTAGPIIDVLPGSKVNIESLTVDGGSAMVGSPVYGIRYSESSGLIKDVEVLNIRNADGSSQGIGIRIESGGPKTNVTVLKSLIQNYTRVGINGNGQGVKIQVKNSTVVGPVDPRVWAPNGIQISRGAEGKVASNFVDNNPSPNPPGGAGSGIILFCAGRTDVYHNTVSEADLGISAVDNANASIHNNLILDSDFDAISLQFLGLFFGDIGCTAENNPLPVENNHIHNNKAVNSVDDGISLANFDPDTDPATPNDNWIHCNKLYNSGSAGIAVFDGIDNKIRNNQIRGSGVTDALDETSGSGTAGTANFWRKNRCDASDPDGLCSTGCKTGHFHCAWDGKKGDGCRSDD